METNMNAAQAVAAVMAEVQAVGKNDSTSGGGPKYRYRSIDGLINGIAPAMHKHGLILVPHVVDVEIVPMPGRSGWTETRMTIEYDVTGPDGSTLTRPVRTFAIGADNGDKGPGKALSYGYKSAISQLLCIPTQDPAMDNEHANIPEAEPLISTAELKSIRSLFDEIKDDERRADAKAAWIAQFGDPKELTVTASVAAIAEAKQIIKQNGA